MTGPYQHKHTIPWIIGILASLALLLIFMNLQAISSSILLLDVKWLIVASIPLIIVVLQSNIIHKFKGLGFEIEMRLEQPITVINLTTKDVLVELARDEKGRVERLRNMFPDELAKIQRLVFKINRADSYRTEAVEQYLRTLKSVRYLEVVNKDGGFIAILPASIFRRAKEIDHDLIDMFLTALQNNTLIENFRGKAITDALSESDNLLVSLHKIRESGKEFLPVLNKDGKLTGIAKQRDIESKIADEVLAAREMESKNYGYKNQSN